MNKSQIKRLNKLCDGFCTKEEKEDIKELIYLIKTDKEIKSKWIKKIKTHPVTQRAKLIKGVVSHITTGKPTLKYLKLINKNLKKQNP